MKRNNQFEKFKHHVGEGGIMTGDGSKKKHVTSSDSTSLNRFFFYAEGAPRTMNCLEILILTFVLVSSQPSVILIKELYKGSKQMYSV